MILIREFFKFIWRRPVSFVKLFQLKRIIWHFGWNMLNSLIFFNLIVRNTFVEENLSFSKILLFFFRIFQKEKSAEYVPDRLFLLNICKEAYEKANLCTDNDENKEDWIYLYMMAKIEEKLHRNRLMSSLKKYVTVKSTFRTFISTFLFFFVSFLGVGFTSRKQSCLSKKIRSSNVDVEFQRRFTRLSRRWSNDEFLFLLFEFVFFRIFSRCFIEFMRQRWNFSIDIQKNRRILPSINWKIFTNFSSKCNKNLLQRVFTKKRRCETRKKPFVFFCFDFSF